MLAWQERWYEQHQEPLAWAVTAMSLKHAADVLLHTQKRVEQPGNDGVPVGVEEIQFRLDKSAMLLFAFAMENAIKAYLLKIEGVPWKDVQARKNAAWRKHDLSALFALAKPTEEKEKTLPTPQNLAEEEKETVPTPQLAMLSAFGQWAGRYPFAWDAESCFVRGNPQRVCDPEALPPTPCGEDDYQKLSAFFDSLIVKSGA
jgi:hypothetical protein